MDKSSMPPGWRASPPASAVRPGSKIDLLGTFVSLGGIAIPSFWQALLFMYVFAVMLRWLPPSGYTSPFVDPWLSAKMLFMPAVVLGTHSAAVLMRQGRSALIEVLEQDYINTARSKGLREKVIIKIDNQSTIALTKNPIFHGHSKHIHMRYHFIRECVEDGLIEVEHVPGDRQKADILTKALGRIKFKDMRELIGVQELTKFQFKLKGEIVEISLNKKKA